MTAVDIANLWLGPGLTTRSDQAGSGWDWGGWAAALPGVVLAVSTGLDLDWEGRCRADADAAGRWLLSVRITAAEILIGPLWTGDGACAGCAQAHSEYRRWETAERPERDRSDRERRASAGTTKPLPARGSAGFPPWLAGLVGTILTSGRPQPQLPPGEAIGRPQTRVVPGEVGGLPQAPVVPGETGGLPQARVAVGEVDGRSRPRPALGEVGGHSQLPVAPGELVAISAAGTVTRHRITRTFRCPVCGSGDTSLLISPGERPEPFVPVPQPTDDPTVTRHDAPFGLDSDRMRAAFGDARFGPLTRVSQNSSGAFPLVEATLLAGTPAGAGRATRFREAEAVAVLEAFERLGGYPHAAPIVAGRSRRELGDLAIDPARLGGYTERQLASPASRVRAYHDDAELDWVWGRPLDGGPARLVPAEAGFYRYGYGLREPGARPYFLESSSGSALGNSVEEAALHSLLELAERDAFLLGWHRQRPLPAIDPASVADPESRMLLRLAAAEGYEVHLLAATADIDVPVVWALAIRTDRGMPASFSTAGCHPDPVRAVRAALWELSQLVAAGLTWDPADIEPMVDDPWLIRDIAHHWRRYTFPELLPRVEKVLGGPRTTLANAFPAWPSRLARPSGGDVTATLDHVAGLFAAAGLRDIFVVDQSTPDHIAAGLAVVKCVVPGIVPMCFGQAHQRLTGLDRLLGTLGPDAGELPLDPHPFP